MSLDSGVYILRTKDNFRVNRLFAAQNIFKDIKHCYESFRNAKSFDTLKEAQQYALILDDPDNEWGISLIMKFKDFSWDEIEEVYNTRIVKAI